MNSRLMKVFKWCGFIIAGLVVVYTVLLLVSGVKLRNARERLASSGRPMTKEQIIPPRIDDKDNAALLYQSAALRLKATGDLWRKIEVNQLSGTNLEEVVKYMESAEVKAALDLLKKGTEKSECRFDLDYSKGAGILLPHLSEIRAMTRLLAVHAKLMAEKGDNEGAWNDIIPGCKLADALHSEPILISLLVRTAQYAIINQAAVDMCKTSLPNETQCEEIVRAIKPFTDLDPLVRAMDGERILMSDWVFDQIESDPGKALGLMTDTSVSVIERIAWRIITCKPLRQFMQASCLDVYADITKFMETPYWSAPMSEGHRMEENIPRWNILGRMLLPAVVNAKKNYASAMAKAEMTMTAMSLFRHKLAHGAFPATLAECDAKFLPLQPIDSFSGKALLYRPEGNGFVLYSVGENMKDDGAKPEPSAEERSKLSANDRDLKAWDLVWKHEGR